MNVFGFVLYMNMNVLGFVLYVLSSVLAIAETQALHFETKSDCLKALPSDQPGELCIKCKPFQWCPSESNWIIDLRRRIARSAGSAGVIKGKCSNGFIMDETLECVTLVQIPITTGKISWPTNMKTTATIPATAETVTPMTTSNTTLKSVSTNIDTMPTKPSRAFTTRSTTGKPQESNNDITILVIIVTLTCFVVITSILIFMIISKIKHRVGVF